METVSLLFERGLVAACDEALNVVHCDVVGVREGRAARIRSDCQFLHREGCLMINHRSLNMSITNQYSGMHCAKGIDRPVVVTIHKRKSSQAQKQ